MGRQQQQTMNIIYIWDIPWVLIKTMFSLWLSLWFIISNYNTYNLRLRFIFQIIWGTPNRALRTLPSFLYVAPSMYPDAGLGVYTSTFLPKYTWLQEYEGEILTGDQEGLISWYAWSVGIQDLQHVVIDSSICLTNANNTNTWQGNFII